MKAVRHDELPRAFELEADAAVTFLRDSADSPLLDNSAVYRFTGRNPLDPRIDLARAASLAFEVALDLDLKESQSKTHRKAPHPAKNAVLNSSSPASLKR